TSGFHAAPDSASRRRHRNRRMTVPEGTMYALRISLAVSDQRVVGQHAVTVAAPFDTAAEEAHDEHRERQDVTQRSHPEQTVTQREDSVEFVLQYETAGDPDHGNRR